MEITDFIKYMCREVVEIRNKFIPNYYTNNPNENKMIGLFELCHT